MSCWGKISQFGSAVWLAIANKYMSKETYYSEYMYLFYIFHIFQSSSFILSFNFLLFNPQTGGVSTVCIGFRKSKPNWHFLFLLAGRSIVEINENMYR